MIDDLTGAGIATCRGLGYDVARPDDGPPAIATPTDRSRLPLAAAGRTTPGDPASGRRPAEVAVEPLAADAVTPTMLASRLWNDSRHDRLALFVVPASAAEDALAVLRSPALVRRRSPAGARSFFTGPDRVPLAEGGYAAVRTDARSPAVDWDWSEEPATGPLDPARDAARGSDATHVTDADAAGDDRRRLVCRVGGEPVAVLDGVDALSCPPTSTFPFVYRRGSDRRFHLRTADGRAVGTFGGVAAMRRSGYHPVPMPLVPEHLLPADTRVGDAWLLLAVPDDAPPIDPARPDRHPPVGATLYSARGRVDDPGGATG